MKRLNKKQTIFLFYGLDLIFFLIMIIVLLPFSRKSKSSTQKSALLNPKYKNEVFEISLKFPESQNNENNYASSLINLSKKENFWILETSDLFSDIYLPADNKTVDNFITNFTHIVTMYKKSENTSSYKAYSLDEGQCVEVSFFDKNSECLSKIYFGITDSFTNRISFRTDNSSQVWETEDSLSLYLTKDLSFWADPYLEPQFISKRKGSELENSLRRGKIITLPEELLNISPDEKYKKVFSNGSFIIYSVYKTSEEYLICPSFFTGNLNSENEKNIFNKINYKFTVSQWTYENFLKQTSDLRKVSGE